jgi:RNA polymerase sigma factor (sigma-70 family)
LSTEAEDPRDLVRKALARDPASVTALVERLSPVIERRVAATLWQRAGRRDVRQEVKDMTQAVFLSLFEEDGKALRAWDPARGSALEGFVALLAHRQVISLLRRGKTSPWPDDPKESEWLEAVPADAPVPEQIIASREHLHTLLDRVREELSPLGLEMFQRLIVDEEPLEEVGAKLGKTPQALYQWRSRLLRRVKELSAEILGNTASATSEASVARRTQEGSSHR